MFWVSSSNISLKVLFIISLSWWINDGAIEFKALSFIPFQVFIRVCRSWSISFLVLFEPAVLTINPISFGIIISLRIVRIFFLSPGLKIFLEIPPPLGVLGIKTIYFPAIEIKVLKAAPFWPLSSFNTWTNITWFGFITSWILYLLNLNIFSGFFVISFIFSCSFLPGVVSLLSEISSAVLTSISESTLISTGSFMSKLPSLIFFSSSFSLFFCSSSLSFSSCSLIFSRSLKGIW